MTDKSMVKNEADVAEVTRETRKRVLRPPVDIFENEAGITLMADLPGVSQEGLNVKVEDGRLSLTGDTGGFHEGKYHWKEFEPATYQRSFHLSDDIDAEKISAELKNGVLTLTLPKAESAKPRRIDINTVH